TKALSSCVGPVSQRSDRRGPSSDTAVAGKQPVKENVVGSNGCPNLGDDHFALSAGCLHLGQDHRESNLTKSKDDYDAITKRVPRFSQSNLRGCCDAPRVEALSVRTKCAACCVAHPYRKRRTCCQRYSLSAQCDTRQPNH